MIGPVCDDNAANDIINGMEKLATDIYTFEKLVKNGFTYIDKTDRLWPLVNKGGYNEAHDSV